MCSHLFLSLRKLCSDCLLTVFIYVRKLMSQIVAWKGYRKLLKFLRTMSIAVNERKYEGLLVV